MPRGPEAAALASRIDLARCLSFAGETTLTELPPLYSLASVMVTNDSGPADFAAATGLPTIVLFGPETPNLYRPLGNARSIYAGLACSPCVSAHNHRKDAFCQLGLAYRRSLVRSKAGPRMAKEPSALCGWLVTREPPSSQFFFVVSCTTFCEAILSRAI